MKHLIKLEENILQRAKLLNESEKNDKVKQALLAICKRDPLYFFDNFLTTDRNA